MIYRDLPDAELAVLLRDGRCAAVEEEVYRRFRSVADSYARRYCRQLFHRGRSCPGASVCEGVAGLAFSEIQRRILGAGGPPPVRSLLIEWTKGGRPCRQSFTTFLFTALYADDILRAWCAERGLPVRGDRPPAALLVDLEDFYRRFWAEAPTAGWPRALAPDKPGVARRWLEGLWRDAVQTGDGRLVDSGRLARWMLSCSAPTNDDVALVEEIAVRLDEHLSRAWPHWYERYLDRGRQLTTPVLSLDAVGAVVAA